MAPGTAHRATAFAGQRIKEEVADVDAGVSTVITEGSKGAVVAGVVAVLAGAEEVHADLQHMCAGLISVVGLELELIVARVGDGCRRTSA